MGYNEEGAPLGLTFVGRPFTEDKLLKMAYTYEEKTRRRVAPKDLN